MGEKQGRRQQVGRVIVGKVNVVKVGVDAWRKTGQHFQDNEVQFAGGGKGVAGVDKEKISGGQLLNAFGASILDLLREEIDPARFAFALEKSGWVGLNADDARRIAFILRGQKADSGGNAATDLNDLLWPARANKAIQEVCLDFAVPLVAAVHSDGGFVDGELF